MVRKGIKNLHLGVYPPTGRVRIAAPLALSDDAMRLAVIDKLARIRRQRAAFASQPRSSKREMVSGESHYLLGRRYRLRVHEHEAPPRVAIRGLRMLDLFVHPGTGADQRLAVLERWPSALERRAELQRSMLGGPRGSRLADPCGAPQKL